MGYSLNREEAIKLTKSIPSIFWHKHELTVVRDGCTSCGIRIHFVLEKGYNGQLLSNAYVF